MMLEEKDKRRKLWDFGNQSEVSMGMVGQMKWAGA